MAIELLKITVDQSGQFKINSAFKDVRPKLILDALNDYAVKISEQVRNEMPSSEAASIENFIFFLDAAFKAKGELSPGQAGECLALCIEQTKKRYPEIYH